MAISVFEQVTSALPTSATISAFESTSSLCAKSASSLHAREWAAQAAVQLKPSPPMYQPGCRAGVGAGVNVVGAGVVVGANVPSAHDVQSVPPLPQWSLEVPHQPHLEQQFSQLGELVHVVHALGHRRRRAPSSGARTA